MREARNRHEYAWVWKVLAENHIVLYLASTIRPIDSPVLGKGINEHCGVRYNQILMNFTSIYTC